MLVLAAAACGYPRPADVPDDARVVAGRVHGLWDGRDGVGVGLRLVAGDVDASIAVAANGGFEFTEPVARGASYQVMVTSSPPGHACAAAAGAGGTVADAELPEVSVGCVGPIEGIALSGPWGWQFDPSEDSQRFDGSIAVQQVSLTVHGSALTGARVADGEVTVGQPTAPIALQLGSTVLPVAVTAGGLSKTYELAFQRGGAVLDQVAYAKASNTGQSDNFGSAIAVSGDTLAVAAVGEASRAVGVDGDQADNTAGASGAVYVFVRDAAGWTQQAYLKASNTESDDDFGWSVALSGDTLAVSAIGEDSAATGSGGNQGDNTQAFAGAVYVFVRAAGQWTQQAYLKASNTGAGDGFGVSVAVSGDTLAVGAPSEDSSATGINPGGGAQASDGAPEAGAVYVFVRGGSTWVQQAYVKPSITGSGNAFGSSVALSGDTLAAGAPGEASRAGAVYVFARTGATWTQQARLAASNAQAEDNLGSAVALSGDGLAAAAPGEASAATGVDGNQLDNSAAEAGAVYVFARQGATWTQQAYLKSSNTRAMMRFGRSLAMSGDAIAVGADRETSLSSGVGGDQGDDGANNAGAAYVFARDTGAWQQRAYVKASNTGAQDRFGCAVALSDDTLAIGALTEASMATGVNGNGQNDNTTSSSGAMYVFR
ncbi:MAG TPA: integrin [Kofleriaceae bacterium]|nr:integrin [Kofleriaceae bacterium]